MGGDKELSSLHGNLSLKPANCAVCHPPHASDHERLVRGELHQPLTLGKCSSCHGGGEERSVVVENVEKRCRMCHPFEQVLQARGATIHEPVSDGECLTCHDPHMSNERALLRQPEADTCGECHDVASPGGGRGLHSPVETCTDCHNPHGGKRDKFLFADPPELCFDCHADPREAPGELHPALDEGCLMCHDPHAGFFPGVQRGDTANAVCLECHDDPTEEKTNVHAALTEGCSACHDPHVSENAGFLREAGNSVCRRCHALQGHHVLDGEQAANAPGSAAFPADGNEFACTGCHEPHASDHARLFVRPKRVLCKECHDVGL
jgi:predicted CXXCH cytochrome family protein